MNFATQALQPMTNSITPFQPRNQRERIVARVIRMMLRYELLRIQLENNLTDADENRRREMHDEAIRLWVAAFHLQRRAAEAGMRFSYDDFHYTVSTTKPARKNSSQSYSDDAQVRAPPNTTRKQTHGRRRKPQTRNARRGNKTLGRSFSSPTKSR